MRNRTSSIAPDRSILKIERILIDVGATNIAKEYENGKVKAVMFSIKKGDGHGHQAFKLPARSEAVLKHLMKGRTRLTNAQQRDLAEQAERTAWKNVMEWVDLQATMIKLDQIEFTEAFFAHAWSITEGKTFFERVRENQYKQLGS
jgi:hypothetical protein